MFSVYGKEEVINKSFCWMEGREGGRVERKKLGLPDFTGLKIWSGVKLLALKSSLTFTNNGRKKLFSLLSINFLNEELCTNLKRLL